MFQVADTDFFIKPYKNGYDVMLRRINNGNEEGYQYRFLWYYMKLPHLLQDLPRKMGNAFEKTDDLPDELSSQRQKVYDWLVTRGKDLL